MLFMKIQALDSHWKYTDFNFLSQFSYFDFWMAAIHSFFSVFILLVCTYIGMNSIQFKNRAKDISSASSSHSAPWPKNCEKL